MPFKDGQYFYESALKKADGSTNKGSFGRAVRTVPDNEFDLILSAGYAPLITEASEISNDNPNRGFADEPLAFHRPIVESMVARPFRDRAFALQVKQAYDNTCAVTGLKLINGGGRPEVQAAHIRPVEFHGPDSIRNGLALSGTIHWMFDRGLISVDDDYAILKATEKIPDAIDQLINIDGCLRPPRFADHRPHPQFLRFHREEIFKG